ncbi:MAG: hypothetical protein JWQ59_1928 [Cryobacterium sp.]|nr:hypothetical protein [Cryobacterium sp.]
METAPVLIPGLTAMDRVALRRVGNRAIVTTAAYRLELPNAYAGFERSPYAELFGATGEHWMDVSLISSVHTTAGTDETWLVDAVKVEQLHDDANVIVRILSRSTAWDRHETVLTCTGAAVELSVAVSGIGEITEATFFGGVASLPSGACGTFRSLIEFTSVLVPAPTEPVHAVRPAQSSAALGVIGDADPGRLHAIYTPPPLVLGLGRELPVHATDVPGGDWIGLSLRAPVANLTFTTMHYDPLENGFLIRLDYEGHTSVHGDWESPVFVLRPAATAWSVLDDYRTDLVNSGCAPAGAPDVAAWWREPIFCGWGAQCARSSHVLLPGPADPSADTAPETREEENLVVRAAPNFARQDVYDEFLARLAIHGLAPGTIVIDDRWQSDYGSGTVDSAHWPDLRAWIADRHADGRKVLLWWKAWDPEGIPAEECVSDAGGRPVSVDPANPAYRARLRGIVASLIGPDGVDADGFKVDFTHRGPSGQSLRGFPGSWGIAALHLLLETLRDAAKTVKPDALVICHAMHPSFADTCDMVRLNDVSKYDVEGRRVPVVDQLLFRHQIASRILPGHLIDTDQWPMPNRAEWLRYIDTQVGLGVPALYYLESIDRSGEHIHPEDLERVAESWSRYREGLRQ